MENIQQTQTEENEEILPKYASNVINTIGRKRAILILLQLQKHKKLRIIQARLIHKTKSSVSFSQVINEIVRKGLKEN